MSGSMETISIQPKGMGKVVAGSISGALLEWYDFFVYGTVSALFFGKVFFPEVDATTGVVASFATFGVGFIARPVGGLVFGHIGDVRGRKSALMWTLGIVGVSTFLIGLLPTYEQIGGWAPGLLVLLRLAQGFGLGGEYGGAALLTIESAPHSRRGFFGSLPQTAASLGILLATGVVSMCNTFLTDRAMHTWGWRVPFWISALMLVVGLFVRSHVAEPTEAQEQRERIGCANGNHPRIPLVRIVHNHPRNLLLAFCARLAETVSSNIVNAFGISYVATQLAVDRQIPLRGMMIASALGVIACPIIGWCSDRWGLKRIYMLGAACVIVLAFPFFMALGTRAVWVMMCAFVLTYNLGPTMMFAVQPTLFTRMFGADVRYTGLSIAYQFSAVVGGLTPMICAALIARFHGAPWGVAAYLVIIALVSFVSVALLRMTSGADEDAKGEWS